MFCQQRNAKVVTIDGYEDVPENDEISLKKAVAGQPVSVAIEAGGRAFQLYQSVSSSTLNNFLNVVLVLTSLASNMIAVSNATQHVFMHHSGIRK